MSKESVFAEKWATSDEFSCNIIRVCPKEHSGAIFSVYSAVGETDLTEARIRASLAAAAPEMRKILVRLLKQHGASQLTDDAQMILNRFNLNDDKKPEVWDKINWTEQLDGKNNTRYFTCTPKGWNFSITLTIFSLLSENRIFWDVRWDASYSVRDKFRVLLSRLCSPNQLFSSLEYCKAFCEDVASNINSGFNK